MRPKLGARLVAFDGASVEVGNWTFDSIRTAIHARPRPLTLSFRNDFLTTDQRRVLTKAINEVCPPLIRSREGPYSPDFRPGVQSSQSYDSGRVRGDFHHSTESLPSEPDNWSVSVGHSATSSTTARPQSFSATRSIGSGSQRSFSEAGSSTSVLSAVAPLVANLMKRSEVFTPDYMRREPSAVEKTQQHQDFQSELL